MADTKRRLSSRSTKRKTSVAENIKDTNKKIRRCEKAGCSDREPSCCLISYDGCTKSGYTSRWYHMSLGEHFCNNCFDYIYRPEKEGNINFNKWINEWTDVARVTKPTIKRYVANELLPYWLKCCKSDCGKWREVQKPGVLDSSFIRNFNCSKASLYNSCDEPEDKIASLAFDPYFIDQLTEAPLLKNSPAAPYLKRFLSEDIGICPLDCNMSPFEDIDDIELFTVNQCGEASIWPKPNTMDEDEIIFITNTLISSATYLGLRNLIVAVWNLSPENWLDINKVNEYLICRGLVRIHLLSLADLILKLLTRKSVINYGLVCNPLKISSKSSESEVLVIGAGISGLAAAKQLQNLGINVTVFEANSVLGGRVKDNPLASRAYFVKGLLNNPFRILAFQAKMEYQKLKGDVLVFDAKGKAVPDEMEKNMQYKMRGIVQGALESNLKRKEDSNWYDVVTSNFKKFMTMTYVQGNYQLFHHLLKLFETELCVDFKNLSLLRWESSTCVIGDTAFFPEGIGKLLNKLAKNLKIVFNTEVISIDYSGDKVKVITADEEFYFSKVLITVPLPALRNNLIKFIPSLPDFKIKVFENLGDYYCAKLVMQFPKKFWVTDTQKSLQEFSIISEEPQFQVFLDVTLNKKNSPPMLVALLTSEGMDAFENKTDKDVVEICVKQLRNNFGKKEVSFPSKWFLTSVEKTDYNSHGSYVKVGCAQTVFDDMAKTVEDKLFFAGEGTFRNIPGSMTGAYLSGLREAAKIADHFD